MICQQLGGINGVCFYISSTFELAGTIIILLIYLIQIMLDNLMKHLEFVLIAVNECMCMLLCHRILFQCWIYNLCLSSGPY